MIRHGYFSFLWIIAFSAACGSSACPEDRQVSGEPKTELRVFRQFSWPQSEKRKKRPLLVFSPVGKRPEEARVRQPRRGKLQVSLKDAIGAKVLVEHWSGHVGTSEKRIRFNGHEWLDLPLPSGTPARPECYFAALTGSWIDVPLSYLTDGENTFELTCGPQICHGFDYPAYSVFGITLRVFLNPSAVQSSAGRIVAPASGEVIDDFPVVQVEVRSGASPVERVDVIARYKDVGLEGDGAFWRWHDDYSVGEIRHHVGTATKAPYRVRWDTTWVPDQSRPIALKAWITDSAGVTFETPIVDGLKFDRRRRVRLYRPTDVPERFHSRLSRRVYCTIPVADDLQRATRARLIVATHGPHGEPGEIGLNDRPLVTVKPGQPGRSRKQIHAVAVPLPLLRNGGNRFYAVSETSQHALEILWPGPALLIEYGERRSP